MTLAHAAPALTRGGRQAGFTLTELVLTFVILGILAVYMVPRFASRGQVAGEFYLDELAAALTYVRTTAIVTGCPVQFSITSSGYTASRPATLCNTSSYSVALSDPTGQPVNGPIPTGAPFTGDIPQTILFGPNGRTNVAVDRTYNSGSRTLTIYASSGVIAVQ